MSEVNYSEYISESIKYQRMIYSPLKRNGFLPENGTELFVRKIPSEDTEYDLLQFFATVGNVFQVRLMMSENGKSNRGFGYVTFFEVSDAKEAVSTLSSVPYRGRHFLIMERSLNNCRLFIGGIPTHKRKDQVWQELYSKGVHNIVDVIMYRSYSDRAENRGFVFVEFRSHEEAARFRAKYGKNLRLWDNPVVVDWSVPVPQVDDAVMKSVKIIYLRNLDVCMTREELEDLALKFISRSSIEKVYKFKNYAFIHLVTRHYAERLMDCFIDEFKHTLVEVAWAKPPNKFTSQDYRHERVSVLSSSSISKSWMNCSTRPTSPKLCCNCSRILRNAQNSTDTSNDSLYFDGRSRSLTSPNLTASQSFDTSLVSTVNDLNPYEKFCLGLLPDTSNIHINPNSTTTNLSQVANVPFNDFAVSRNTTSHELQNVALPLEIMENTPSQVYNISRPTRSIPTRPVPLMYHPNSVPTSNSSSSFENFCKELSLAQKGVKSTSFVSDETLFNAPASTLLKQLDPIDIFQANLKEIYGRSGESVKVSSSSSSITSFQSNDLAVVPRDITLDDLQDIIGDILD